MGLIDIHWHRQDKDNTWSHKRGLAIVKTSIANPLDDISDENYTECNRFCVKKSGVDLDKYFK